MLLLRSDIGIARLCSTVNKGQLSTRSYSQTRRSSLSMGTPGRVTESLSYSRGDKRASLSCRSQNEGHRVRLSRCKQNENHKGHYSRRS